MLDYKCPECSINLNKIDSITNIHFTGDEKYFVLYKCPDCQKYYLIVSMEATVGPGTNYFTFRINLKDFEAIKIKDLMGKCSHTDECNCPVHKYLDDFDSNNHDRRVILENEIERWLTPDEIKNKEGDVNETKK